MPSGAMEGAAPSAPAGGMRRVDVVSDAATMRLATLRTGRRQRAELHEGPKSDHALRVADSVHCPLITVDSQNLTRSFINGSEG